VHGDFVAVGKLDAVDAIGPDNGEQVFPRDDLKTEALEKVRHQGQEEDFAQADGPGLLQTGLHQAGGDVLTPVGWRHGDGADFTQAGPTDVQGGDADNRAMVLPVDVVVPQLAIEIGQGPGQDTAILGEFHQEPADFRNFINLGFAYHFGEQRLRKDDFYDII
jgi:hypothetical protein